LKTRSHSDTGCNSSQHQEQRIHDTSARAVPARRTLRAAKAASCASAQARKLYDKREQYRAQIIHKSIKQKYTIVNILYMYNPVLYFDNVKIILS